MSLLIRHGDDEVLDILVTEADGTTALDLTGMTLRFTAKRSRLDPDDEAIFAKSTGDGVTITDAVAGAATVTIVPADTEDLVNERHRLWYDLQLRDDLDKIRTLVSGVLIVEPDVTYSGAS